MTKPILFLDIDGVLTTRATGYRHGDPECVARLNRITNATGAAIVVSSTWRHDPEIAKILLGWRVTGEVIGITPDLSTRLPSGLHVDQPRGIEIARWLDDHPGDYRFVILDDDRDMAHLIDFLVRTDSLIGLQESGVERAITMLGRRPRRIQRKRSKGWKMPPGAIYVGRPSRWGNPFEIGIYTRDEAVELYGTRLEQMQRDDPNLFRDLLEPLRGHDLACWCPLDQPCHADLLLELLADIDIQQPKEPSS